MTKWEAGIEVQATILPSDGVYHTLVVIHRFDSGNFYKEETHNLSLVAAEGLQRFYTE